MTTVIRGIVLRRLKFHQQTNEKSKKKRYRFRPHTLPETFGDYSPSTARSNRTVRSAACVC